MASPRMTGGPNETIHQSMRLRIMAALDEDQSGAPLTFPRLKSVLDATDGNLGAHLKTLETAGFIRVAKEADGTRIRTTVSITQEGRSAFLDHLNYLRSILPAL
jgi:DNA-binding MarR family transcriptional regulator